jgi:hypothetical protein
MRRNPRVRVERFETRPNLGPSRDLWAECSTAILVCGHEINLGVGTDYRPRRMACQECGAAGGATEVGRRARSAL